MDLVLAGLLGAIAVGAVAAVLVLRTQRRTQQLVADTASLRAELGAEQGRHEEAAKKAADADALKVANARLEQQLKDTAESLGQRDALEKRFTDSFAALSSKTLETQRKSFLTSADENLKAREKAVADLVKPLSEKIETLDKAVSRHSGDLGSQIKNVLQSNRGLEKETRQLRDALSKPQVRGQWGEMQVERVLELCNLVKDMHYTTQDPDGKGGRTDFIVHMPHNRDIILDSKVPLTAYLEAEEAETPEDRERHLDRHAQLVRGHADGLSKKDYPQSLKASADFVVMVLPEFALPPALSRYPDLLDRGLQSNVIIVTYSTLGALLKCVALSWQERQIADEAQRISELGKELHDRLATFADHMAGMGRALNTAVTRYNDGVGSMESRVLTQARRFRELGVSTTRDLPELQPIDATPRALRQGQRDVVVDDDVEVAQNRLRDPSDPVLDWGEVRRDLLDSD